jgi:hypothetical protein
VASVVSTGRGHDASYPFKTTGAAEGPVITGQCGAGYYLSAVEKGRRARRDPAIRVRVGLPARQQPGALDFTALLRGRQRASRVDELGTLRDPARTIWHAVSRASVPSEAHGDARANSHRRAARLAPRGELTHAAITDAATRGRGWRLDGRSG